MAAEVRAWLVAIASFGTFLTAIVTAWLAYKKYLKEETSTPTPNRLTVFSTSQQTTELRATEEGLECYLFDLRPNRDKGLQWRIPIEHLKDTKISIYPSEKREKGGLFAVGSRYDWYYSKSLFKTEKDLHDAIRELIDKSIELASKKKT